MQTCKIPALAISGALHQGMHPQKKNLIHNNWKYSCYFADMVCVISVTKNDMNPGRAPFCMFYLFYFEGQAMYDSSQMFVSLYMGECSIRFF